MKLKSILRSLTVVLVCLAGCSRRLRVEYLPEPDYPPSAQFQKLQGTVTVDVLIAADGKVISATGSGAAPTLQQAAEDNAKQWSFGPFPAVSQFPIHHTIKYVYTLEGKPVYVRTIPRVTTHLPDRVDVIATPLESDYPEIQKPQSSPKIQPRRQ